MTLVLRGGLVADGIGTSTAPADVLIAGSEIAAIVPPGTVTGDHQVIDLTPGSVVCPGFIDAHAHAEGPLLASGRVDGALAQGVTTLVVGQDGQSWIGASAATVRYLNRYFAPVNGPLEPAQALTVAGYRAAVAGRLSQNVAVLASQGTIRHNVAGLTSGPLAPAALAAARAQVEQALSDGAAGLSSGLDYLPSRLSAVAELAELARPLAAAGRPYVSHLRDYGPGVAAGLAELAQVGARSGARVHASHLWGPAAIAGGALNRAEADGVAISFDAYPYRRSSTILAMTVLPPELQAGGPDATLAALARPADRAALLARDRLSSSFLARVYLASLPPDRAALAGRSVAEAAAASGRPAGEWTLDLLAATSLQVGAHLDRPSLTPADLAALAADPRHCTGSDAIYQGQHPHPRARAAFAAQAQHYLAPSPGTAFSAADRTRTAPAAGDGKPSSGAGEVGARYQLLVRHLASHAADVYGLQDRGRLIPGLAADICVIGPGGLVPRATYEQPRLLAEGISLVLVNGVIAWPDGRTAASARPGRALS